MIICYEVKTMIKKIAFILPLILFLIMVFLSVNQASASTDTDFIASVTWPYAPFWINATTITFPSVSVPMYVLPAVTTNVLTDLKYLTSTIYVWKYTATVKFTYGGYTGVYAPFMLNGSAFPEFGFWDYSDTNTYTTVRVAVGPYPPSLGSSISLSYGVFYDFVQYSIWNCTTNTATTQLKVFSAGTTTQIGSTSTQTVSSSSFSGSVSFVWAGGGGNIMVIENENVYKGTLSPSPPGHPSVSFLDIPANLALATGLSLLSAGLVCGFMLELACVLPVLVFTDNTLVITIFAIIGLCLGVAFQWLPYVCLILIVLIIALMYADKFRKILTSGEGEK
jgi:hypothetical protein